MMYCCQYDSPIGPLLLTSDGAHLTGLYMDRQLPEEVLAGEEPQVLRRAKAWLEEYFSGLAPRWLPPLLPEGTPFQKRIWGYLLEIPYGEVCTYGQLAARAAEELGREKMSSQAVGGAVGRNPISIMIPCHRCVGAGGALTGYAWGLERKRWLLRHEEMKGTVDI